MHKKLIVLLILATANLLSDEDINIGIVYVESGRPDLAVLSFKRHLEEDLTPEERAVTLYNLGSAYMSEGSLSQAEKVFHEVNSDAISSPIVKQSLLYNQALCFLQLAERAVLLEGEDKKAKITEYVKQAEAIMPLLDKKVVQAMEEEILFIHALSEQKGMISAHNEVMDFLYRQEQLLLSYLELSSEPTLYSEAIRDLIFRRTGIVLPKVSGTELVQAIDEKRFLLDVSDQKDSSENIKRAFENSCRAEILSFSEKSTPFQRQFWKKRVEDDTHALQEMLLKKIKNPPPHTDVQLLKSVYAKTKGDLFEAYLLFDPIACLQFEIEQLKKEFSKELLHIAISSFQSIQKALHLPHKNVSELNTLLSALLGDLFPEQKNAFIAAIEYWLFYGEGGFEKDPKAALQFAITFEEKALQCKENNERIEEVTVNMLAGLRAHSLAKTHLEEIDALSQAVQNGSESSGMYILAHKQVLEFLKKILKENEKAEKEESSLSKAKPTKNKWTISSDEAAEYIEEMERDDKSGKEPIQRVSGVKYPW